MKIIDWKRGLDKLPEHMRAGVERYVEAGIHPGDFLTLVLENDFVHAACQADLQNQAALLEWARFLYCHAPMSCWGSADKVSEWIRTGGLEGHEARRDRLEASARDQS